jgi:hypothetical protein
MTMANDPIKDEKPKPLDCGLPYEEFGALRNETAFSRLNYDEGLAVFDKLHEHGFKIVPRG